MLDQKYLIDVIKRLNEKTKLGQVRWLEGEFHASQEFSQHSGTEYYVEFPKSSIYIRHRLFDTAPDDITVEVQNGDGRVVGSIMLEPDNDDYAVLESLLDSITKFVFKADETKLDIEKALSKEGTIGMPQIDPNDIPF